MKRRIPFSLIIVIVLAIAFLVIGATMLGRYQLRNSATVETAAPMDEKGNDTAAAAIEVGSQPEPETQLQSPAVVYSAKLTITEACPKNKAAILDPFGQFTDWLELYNAEEETVDLSGWFLSDNPDNNDKYTLPDGTTIASGEYLVLFAQKPEEDNAPANSYVPFGLSAGETLCLFYPDGTLCSSLALPEEIPSGYSASLQNGDTVLTGYVTPGYENSDAGLAAYQNACLCTSPLQITEVLVGNYQYNNQPNDVGYSDIVELTNVSDSPVDLGDYSLSDSADDLSMWALPRASLQPGQSIIYYCSGDESLTEGYFVHTNFSLDASSETLFLSKNGELSDYLWLHDIPVGGSCGRLDGQNGLFYFAAATPKTPNVNGARMVSDRPVSHGKDGVYNNVDSVTVELSAKGTIYYSTDCSVPTDSSHLYSAPITLQKTGVIRAVAIEEGKLPSAPVTLSYIINENHSLPVVSLVSERKNLFNSGIYDTFWTYNKVPASMSLYEEDSSFTADCGLKMYGHTGLQLPKKSFKVLFKGRFGTDGLNYDLFDSEIQSFSSIVLRAGQDYTYSIIRDELFEKLSSEFTDNVLVQRNKYCILYLDGEYYGIYCIKEAFSEEYYASERGVSVDSVTQNQAPVGLLEEFRDVINFTLNNNLSIKENYDSFCSMVNIDSLIDWCIVEGYSANGDVQQNLRYFRSTENGNRWEYAFYDLDWAFYYPDNSLRMVFGGGEVTYLQHFTYTQALLANDEFKQAFCTRLAEAMNGVFSNEHVLATIDELENTLQPEIARERERWGGSEAAWHVKVQELRDFVTQNDWENAIRRAAVLYCGQEYYDIIYNE